MTQMIKIMGFSSRTTSVLGGVLHYFEKKARNSRGSIVLLHGIGSNATHFWRVMGPLHRAGYSVYALDLPGHGRSPDLSGTMTSELLHQMFAAWANQVVLGKFILVGNSLGGAMGLRFSLQYPSRVNRLILISPGGGFESEGEWEKFKEELDFKSVEESIQVMPKIFHQVPFYMPLFYGSFFRSMRRKGVQDLIRLTRFEDFRLDEGASTFVLLPQTLFIWGQSEKLFPRAHLAKFKRILGSQVIFEEPASISHCPQLENPGWLSQRILEFSRSVGE